MRNFLPSSLVELLRDRYIARVVLAAEAFEANSADEDSVTGALGQMLLMSSPLAYQEGGETYSVQVSYRKIRGRGLNAPERLYGTDGIFQIAILDASGQVAFTKGLPFQSKVNWRGRDSRLTAQASEIQFALGGGIVVDYAATGYMACSTLAVLNAGGDRGQIDREGRMHSLGHVLGIDFLECYVGREGLFFDAERERFIQGEDVLPPRHALTTVVRTARG